MSKRVLHCWEDGPLDGEPCTCKCACNSNGVYVLGAVICDECHIRCWFGVRIAPSSTCMLRKGHLGEHRWTLDSKIGVSFEAVAAS